MFKGNFRLNILLKITKPNSDNTLLFKNYFRSRECRLDPATRATNKYWFRRIWPYLNKQIRLAAADVLLTPTPFICFRFFCVKTKRKWHTHQNGPYTGDSV